MFKLSKIPAFGFLRENAVIGATKVTHSEALSHNIRKTVSYLPGLSLIQGIEHLVRATQNKKEYSSHFIFRSIVEMLGLGFLLLIPDIIMTCVRQHQKATPTSLQARKIVPVSLPTPIPSPVFADKVQEFVQPTPPSPPEPKPKPLPPEVELIKQHLHKLSGLNQTNKLVSYLERRKLDLTNKEIVDGLKQLMLDEASVLKHEVIHILDFLYIHGALTESSEDVEFYKTLGIKLPKVGKDLTHLIQALSLDLDQQHCLDAVTAIVIAKVQTNPGISVHSYLEDFGITGNTPEQKIALFKIAKEAARHNPGDTLTNLAGYKLTEAQKQEIQALAKFEGLEEKKEKAIKLASHSLASFKINWKLLDFNLANKQEFKVVRDIALTLCIKNAAMTFKFFGPPMNTPVNTLEGLAFWREFALEMAQHSYARTRELLDLLSLSDKNEEHKTLIQDVGLKLIQKNPQRVLYDQHILCMDHSVILEEIKKLSQKPLAAKEALLRDILKTAPGTFLQCCNLVLTDSAEDIQLKKTIAVQMLKMNVDPWDSGHFDQHTTQELLLAAASSATYQEAKHIYKKITTLTSEFSGDKEFHYSLYKLLAKKDPSILSCLDQSQFDDEEKRFEVLREIGLSLAALDGATFKKDAKFLGFNLDNEKHANALKEMLQLAIADDGYKNLEDFAHIAPSPNKRILSAKQTCNLLALHIGTTLFDPDDILCHVIKEDWDSPDGIAAREELIVRLASGSLNQHHNQATILKVMEGLPDFSKAAHLIVPHDKDALFMDLSYKMLCKGDKKGPSSLLKEYVKHFGPAILSKFATFVSNSKEISSDHCFQLFYMIVQLSPKEYGKFPGNKMDAKTLQWTMNMKGSDKDSLQAALHEASFPDAPLLHNLPYYQLENPLEVVAKHFSIVPEKYLDKWTKPSKPVKWEQVKEIMLKGAEKMSSQDLKIHFNSMFHVIAKYGSGDTTLAFELAKVFAANGSLELIVNKFRLTDEQFDEVLKIAYLEDQVGTIDHLDVFGVPASQAENVAAKLAAVKVEGDLQERAQKAMKAIQRSPAALVQNLPFYFSVDEVIPEEVGQAYLNVTYDVRGLSKFGISDPQQMAKMVLITAKASPKSHLLLEKNILHDSLQLNLNVPADCELLFNIWTIILEKHPYQMAENTDWMDFDFSAPLQLEFLTNLVKHLAKKDPKKAFNKIKAYCWNFSKAAQIDALTDMLKEIAKYKELDKFPFSITNIKLAKLKHDVEEVVPPITYKEMKLF